jgi:glycosyltransferase involved in cell wall biosynthesis
MNILLMTNTYAPHVGGVARSVAAFANEFRILGHGVLVVAPTFEGAEEDDEHVIRVRAIEHFRQTDFSLPLPLPHRVLQRIDQFEPAVIHSQHPFLLGHSALRIGASRDTPVVFTHHTQYERYAHYVTGESALAKHFIIDLVAAYCELCNAVIAPSETIAETVRERGVQTSISVIPTGVDVERFAAGNGVDFRRSFGIPRDAFVVGHVGRLAPEKNLGFLAEAVAEYLGSNDRAWFVVVGVGPSEREIIGACAQAGVGDRLVMLGVLPVSRQHDAPGVTSYEPALVDAYQAMDVFAFSSQSETQGIVLAEAMAAGTPVVAVDAPGVREIVRDHENGRLLPTEKISSFVEALWSLGDMQPQQRRVLQDGARQTANELSMPLCAERMLSLYESVLPQGHHSGIHEHYAWAAAVRRAEEEFSIWKNVAGAIADALVETVLGAEV